MGPPTCPVGDGRGCAPLSKRSRPRSPSKYSMREGRGGGGQKTASTSRRSGMLFFHGPDLLTSSPLHPQILGRCSDVYLASPSACLFFFFLISRVSYLYIVMLMSNSGGADGLGVSGSQSLWISLPITHLAPVAISPRALWWRRPPRRPLGAGAFAFFFSGLRVPPICLAHERAPVAAACSAPQCLPGSGAEAFHLCPFSSSPTPARAPLLLCPPRHPPPPTPTSEEAAVVSFLGIAFTPVWASDEKNSPSRLRVSKEPSEIQ